VISVRATLALSGEIQVRRIVRASTINMGTLRHKTMVYTLIGICLTLNGAIEYFPISSPKVSLVIDVDGFERYNPVTAADGRQNQSAVVSDFRSIILAS
jgi:hypothetical protein